MLFSEILFLILFDTSLSLNANIFPASKAEFSAPDWPIATVATGTPLAFEQSIIRNLNHLD